MTNPRTIHDYLDGTLTAADEAALFGAMSADDAARRELTDQIRLHLAVKKDMAAITVPADATASIFSELGYALPADLAPAAPSTPTRSRWLLPLLLLLFLGTGIVGTRLLWPPTIITMTSPQPASMITTQKVGPYSPPSSMRDEQPADGVMAVMAPRVDDHKPRAEDHEPRAEDHEPPLTISPVSRLSTSPQRHETSPLTHTPPSYLNERPKATVLSTASPWRAIARGVATLSTTPDFGTDSAAASAWSQFTFGASYHLTDDDILSVVGGRQLVAQEFTRNEWGRDVLYRQTPLLWWGGVMAEHAFSDLAIGNAITPYAAGTVAWMQTGPMARLAAGIHLFRHQQLSFDLGVEGMIMAYPIQSTYYTSQTVTITYGLSYRF